MSRVRVTHTKEELIAFVHQFKEYSGRFPERRDFDSDPNYPSSRQYIREWGSWGKALMDITGRTTRKEKKMLKSFKCINCEKEFQAYAVSSIGRKFCSLECRDIHKSLTHSSVPSTNTYRRIAFRSYPWKCEICGFEEFTNYLYGKSSNQYPTILDVHHIDGNRKNNNFRNLSIICPLCHAKIERGILRNLKRGERFLNLSWEVVPVDEYLELVSSKMFNYRDTVAKRVERKRLKRVRDNSINRNGEE